MWGIPVLLCRPLSSGVRQRLNLSYFRSSNHDLPRKHSDGRILTSHFCVTYISRPPCWINNPDDCRNIQRGSATIPGAPLNTNTAIGKYWGKEGHKRYEKRKKKRPVDSKALLIERIRFQRSTHYEYIRFVEQRENLTFIGSKVLTFRSMPKLGIRTFGANLTHSLPAI